MAKRKTPYGSIWIELDKLAALRAVKAEWERRSGGSFRWGDFLMMLITLHEAPGAGIEEEQVPVAEMHQDEPLTDEQLAAMGVQPDDAMTLEMAALAGTKADLSEGTIEALATKVAERVLGQLEEKGQPGRDAKK